MAKKRKLADELQKTRTRAGLTAAEAARQIGIARTAYRLWEMGSAYPEAKHWRRVADFAGVSLADVLHEAGVYSSQEHDAVTAVEKFLRSDSFDGILKTAVSGKHISASEADALRKAAKLLE